MCICERHFNHIFYLMAPCFAKRVAMNKEDSCCLNLPNIEESCLLRGKSTTKTNFDRASVEDSTIKSQTHNKPNGETQIIKLSYTETTIKKENSILEDEYGNEKSNFGRVKDKINFAIKDSTNCNLCKRKIENKYLLHALDKYWHEKCLKCDFCRKPLYKLGDKFFFRQGAKFCQEDFLRTFGDRGTCCMCDHAIPPTDYVLRFKNRLVYHLDCFKCTFCRTRFCVGDPVTISDPKNILCGTCKYIPMEVLKRAYVEKYDEEPTKIS